jgi:hypothetical protein
VEKQGTLVMNTHVVVVAVVAVAAAVSSVNIYVVH